MASNKVQTALSTSLLVVIIMLVGLLMLQCKGDEEREENYKRYENEITALRKQVHAKDEKIRFYKEKQDSLKRLRDEIKYMDYSDISVHDRMGTVRKLINTD